MWRYAGLLIYTLSLFISQATMSIGAAVALIGFLIQAGGPRKLFLAVKTLVHAQPALKIYVKVTAFFMAACLLSVVVAYIHPLIIGGVSPPFAPAKDVGKVWYFFWPLLLAHAWLGLSDPERRKIMQVYFIAAAVIALLTLPQLFTGFPKRMQIDVHSTIPLFHATGFWGHHLSFASIMIFPFFMGLAQALKPERVPIISRKFAVTFSVVCLVALYCTYSRTLWFALPIGCLILVSRYALAKWKRRFLLTTVIAAVALFQIPVVKERIFFSNHDRIQVWEANIALFKRRVITGVGWHKNADLVQGYYNERYPDPSQRIFVSHAHNVILHFLAGTGILGTLGLLAWAIYLLFLAYRLSPPIFSAMIVFHLNGLTQLNLLESKVLHMFTFMTGLLLFLAFRDRKDHSFLRDEGTVLAFRNKSRLIASRQNHEREEKRTD